MARPPKPINLMQAKRRLHRSEDEIKARKARELHPPSDMVQPPDFLTAKQKREFTGISAQLEDLGIMSNLDCNALGQYLVAKDEWIRFTKLAAKLGKDLGQLAELEKVTSMQDKAFKRCRACATDLGLTISSRCRLALPAREEKETDKNADLFGDAAG